MTSFDEFENFTGVTSIGFQCFKDSSLTCIILPNNIKTVEGGAFLNSINLESIILNEGLENIGNSAFRASGIKTIHIPSSVRTVGEWLFADSALEHFTMPDSWTSIPFAMFNQCHFLKDITISANIQSIALWTFDGCISLQWIKVLAVKPPIMTETTFNNTNNCPIYVPFDSVNAYKTATDWKHCASRIQPIID